VEITMQLRIRLLTGCLALLALPLAASAQQTLVEEANARTTPWSGYWWPLWEGRLLGPLTKHDQFTKNQAEAFERKRNPPNTGQQKWWGYCHAWSAACVIEKEPTEPRTIKLPDGRQLTLTVGDMNASNFHGKRNYSDKIDEVNMTPDLVWQIIDRYIKKQGVPVIMDIDPGNQVWNYPCYAYRIESTPLGGDRFSAYMTLWFADDCVLPDYVGTKPMKKTYTFTYRKRGGNILMGSAQWEGTSKKDHPDFCWYPYLTRSDNPQIDYKKVREMVGMGTRPIADPPKPEDERPVVQPANPPQPSNSTETAHQPPALVGPGPALEGVALSPTELATLLVNKTSKFNLDVKVEGFNPELPLGTPYSVNVKSGMAGYLYLFRVDRDGKCSLLFPKVGQDNRIAEKKLTEIGADHKMFAAVEPLGTQWIKAIVTEKPMRLAGLDQQQMQRQQQKQQQHQETDFQHNPSTQQQTQQLLKAVFTEDKTVDIAKEVLKIKKETGDDPGKTLGDFAQADCVFVVKGPGKVPTPPVKDNARQDAPAKDKPDPKDKSEQKDKPEK
jgi:hypothetical protein